MDNSARALRVISDLASQLAKYGDEALDVPDELDAMGDESGGRLHDLLAVRSEMAVIQRAVKAALAMTDELIIEELGDDAIRYGDSFVSVSRKRQRRVIDTQALWDFIDSFDESPRDLFNPNTVRVTALRSRAAQRGIDPATIEATFFDTEWKDDRVLAVKPMDKAPASMQDLNDGERRRK